MPSFLKCEEGGIDEVADTEIRKFGNKIIKRYPETT
jgi:hypothetical protein